MTEGVGHRLAEIRRQMERAAGGRAVTLVAASKFQSDETVRALCAQGVRDIGENYPQALAARASALADLSAPPRWHLLGGLQTNKARLIAPIVDVVHSIDHERVAQALSRAWQATGRARAIDVYLQVDGGDPGTSRRGCRAGEVAALARHVRTLAGLSLRGLMVLPPAEGPAAPVFAALAALSRSLQGDDGPLAGAPGLSMGMSDDFSLAIAEGATVVRIGSALFGPRRLP